MTILTDSVKATLRANVVSGAALLDSKSPGWRAKVTVEDLNINLSHKCVLGQVYGGYSTGCQKLKIDHYNNHGFNYPLSMGDAIMEKAGAEEEVMEFLTDEWLKVIG